MGIKTVKLVLHTNKKPTCPSNSNFQSGLHYFQTRLKNIIKICKSIGMVGENINVWNTANLKLFLDNYIQKCSESLQGEHARYRLSRQEWRTDARRKQTSMKIWPGIFTIWHIYQWHFYQCHFYHLTFLPLAFLPSGIFTTGIFTIWHIYQWHFYHLAYLPMTFLLSGIFINDIFTIGHIYQWHFYHMAFLPMAFLPMAILPMAFLPMAFLPHTPTAPRSWRRSSAITLAPLHWWRN